MNPINISTETARRIAEMDQTLLFHQVMTQAHRWFQPYEQPECDLQNQLDILASDVHIQTSLGEANGHQVYAQRFTSLPANWRNAHHVQTATVRRLNDGVSALNKEEFSLWNTKNITSARKNLTRFDLIAISGGLPSGRN
ncbi:hypothetical protein KSF_005410 [Reticulibacter mediterranei]|uniref:Uncharacterized protein n=2 Tax=Reticulibacter mediterranei TaxID=2778369 RepID=A0A8J3IDD4_9CHLR|nr:hypothetical protein KSF_005410 [Reticulibacter mediterranei]